MKIYHRATITVPTDIYKKVRISAAHQNKSISKYITDCLRSMVKSQDLQDMQPLPIGKYRLKGKKKLDRKNIYESYLRHKVSS